MEIEGRTLMEISINIPVKVKHFIGVEDPECNVLAQVYAGPTFNSRGYISADASSRLGSHVMYKNYLDIHHVQCSMPCYRSRSQLCLLYYM